MASKTTLTRTPAERRMELMQRATARGWKPMTPAEFREHLAKFRNLWQNDQEIDEFIAWLHKSRKEGG